jgi:DNA modification methylase
MKVFDNGIVQLWHGDCLDLSFLEDESVNCVVTSPPYWGLRDYGLGEDGIGLEPTPNLYVEHIVEVFREVRRVLRDDGTVWLNMGDSYSHGGNGARDAKRWPKQSRNANGFRATHEKKSSGLKPKDLVMMPARVALAL